MTNADDASKTSDRPSPHVVIIGGGVAGLMAARSLLRHYDENNSNANNNNANNNNNDIQITLVEAQNRLGGRVQADKSGFVSPSIPLDIGAEFIHSIDTVLTRTIAEVLLPKSDDFHFDNWEHYFVTAHADGGPDEKPTRAGKYGKYFVNGELLNYDDPSLVPLSDALDGMVFPEQDGSGSGAGGKSNDKGMSKSKDNRSVADALASYNLSPALMRLAVAGYGNTAGCTDMEQLSLQVLTSFERYWEENEKDGDYRLPGQYGMTAVVKALEQELRQDSRITIRLEWPVQQVDHDYKNIKNGDVHSLETAKNPIIVQGVNKNGEHLTADAVICTAPPPLLPQLLPNLLTDAQRETLEYIGFEPACKVIFKFNVCPWQADKNLQSVICADGGPVPEMWFREFDNDQYLIVCYFLSGIAEKFLQDIEPTDNDDNGGNDDYDTIRNQKAADLCLPQFAKVLSVPLVDLHAWHVGTLIHAWNAEMEPYTPGGYMYPRTGLQTLEPMARPCLGNAVFLAGEATNAGAASCTVQSAMESGVRAARQVFETLSKVSATR